MNQVRLALSTQEFLGPKAQTPAVDELLRHCLATKAAFVVDLGPREARLEARPAARSGPVCVIRGRWRSHQFREIPATTGALLLLPFLCWIDGLRFEPTALTTLGRDTRTVADLVMRLVYGCAVRTQPFTFESTSSPSAALELSKGLQKNYLWMLRSMLRDPLLQGSEASVRLLAAAHLPGFETSSPLLQAGAAQFRQIAGRELRASAATTRRRRLVDLRERWIASSHH